MAGPCADIKDRMRRVLGIPPGQGDILEVAAQRHPSIFWMDSREKENGGRGAVGGDHLNTVAIKPSNERYLAPRQCMNPNVKRK